MSSKEMTLNKRCHKNVTKPILILCRHLPCYISFTLIIKSATSVHTMGMRTGKITKLPLSDFLKENPKPIQQKKTERENYMSVVSWEKMAMLTNGLEIRILAMLPNGLEIWIQAMLPNGLQQSSALAAKHVLEGSGRERCFAKRWFSKWIFGIYYSIQLRTDRAS